MIDAHLRNPCCICCDAENEGCRCRGMRGQLACPRASVLSRVAAVGACGWRSQALNDGGHPRDHRPHLHNTTTIQGSERWESTLTTPHCSTLLASLFLSHIVSLPLCMHRTLLTLPRAFHGLSAHLHPIASSRNAPLPLMTTTASSHSTLTTFSPTTADIWSPAVYGERYVEQRTRPGLELIERILHAPLSRPIRRVFDLGCGTGRFIPSLLFAFKGEVDVVGLDSSEAMLTKAKAWVADELGKAGKGEWTPRVSYSKQNIAEFTASEAPPPRAQPLVSSSSLTYHFPPAVNRRPTSSSATRRCSGSAASHSRGPNHPTSALPLSLTPLSSLLSLAAAGPSAADQSPDVPARPGRSVRQSDPERLRSVSLAACIATRLTPPLTPPSSSLSA